MDSKVTSTATWALSAQGAYALFDEAFTPEEALVKRGDADFTPAEAARFIGEPAVSGDKGFTLLHHQPNEFSGFSASVFFENSSRRYVLSVRGTEGPMDGLEDIARIGLQGFAGDQLVSLYRYYKRLVTPTGQAVPYSDAEVAQLASIRSGVFLSPSSGLFESLKNAALRAELSSDRGVSVLPPGAPLIVTGHSLGGHLALLVGRLFPEVTEHVYTYNAPGIGIHGELALRQLGIPPLAASLVTNVASDMGTEAISRIWSKPGENIGIATEPGSAIYKHSIVPLADALSVYGAIAELSPGTGQVAISSIVLAASPYPEQDLEVALDDLRGVLGTYVAPTAIATTLADLGARDDYYTNLYALLDSREVGHDYQIQSLVGKSAAELAALASNDASVRFALRELNPFAARGADYSDSDELFSGQWLASRAEWLQAKLEGNLVDRAYGLSGTADNVVFRDLDEDLLYAKLDGTQATLAGQVSSLADRNRLQQFLDGVAFNRSMVFGSDSAGDAVSGLAGGDRLFGGGGSDSLDGAGGDDYLEGGAGADMLSGGDGADTLAGGEGADRLEGGAGSDRYLFGDTLDADTIADRDGAVYAGTALLTGGSGASGDGGGTYASSDGKFQYAFSGDLSAGGTLIVNGALRVEGFRNGDLGIRLVDASPIRGTGSTRMIDTTLLGDSEYEPIQVSPTVFIGLDEFGNPRPETLAGPLPGNRDTYETFPGTPDNTRFIMGAGDDDLQEMLGGDDWMELGEGNDAAFGGTGNDLLEGGPGRDILAGGRGDDTLYAGAATTRASDLAEDGIPSGGTGDFLSGGDGNDVLTGSVEADLIEGGAGSDVVFAGPGDDWIGSDVAGLAAGERYDVHPPNNDWINRSVDVLWGISAPPTYSIEPGSWFGSPATARIRSGTLNPNLDPDAGDADGIDAGPGNDTIFAGGGGDTVHGGDGDDFINAGGGDDRVFGGAGNDYIVPGSGADIVIAGDGDDFIQNTFDTGGKYVDGGRGNDDLYGGPGNDILVGGDGDDRLGSSGGFDVLIGGDGRDFIGVGGGSAIVDGGAGDDTLSVKAALDGTSRVRVGRGSGADILEARGGPLVVEVMGDIAPQDVSVEFGERTIPSRDEEGGVETLTGILLSLGEDGDSLFLADVSAASRPTRTTIEFADGTVWDDADLQSLLDPPEETDGTPDPGGSADAELIYGTAAADVLSGAGGDDWLVGNAGDDTYLYAGGDGFDLIEDTDGTPGNTDVLRFADGIHAADLGVYAAGEDYVLTAGSGGVRIRDGRTQAGAIERFEFFDGTAWSAAEVEARAEVLPGNRAPAMPSSLGGVSVDPGAPLAIELPAGIAVDPDRFDSVTLHAITADGERLPGWLHFDPVARTLSGTPDAGAAGAHELLLVAVDSSGTASVANLTISVTGGESAPDPAGPAALPAVATEEAVGIDAPAAQVTSPGVRPGEFAAEIPLLQSPAGGEARVGVPFDPLFRDMQQRFDVLLQVGRPNLADRYLEAIREFEERRLQREEAPAPPPTDDEVAAWNDAMHAWHDRNPGFGEADLGGEGGSWSLGWGLPGPGDGAAGGAPSAGTLPGLATSLSNFRIPGAASAPMLGEGLRALR